MKSIRLRDWEVRAILNGATQIRRLVTPQPVLLENGVWAKKSGRSTRHLVREIINTETGDSTSEKVSAEDTILELWKSPFGKPGDVLIHKASRLEIVTKAVRVERVQEISEADAIAFGVERNWDDEAGRSLGQEWDASEHGWMPYGGDESMEGFPAFTARDSFRGWWIKNHGPDSWDRNDFVWAGEFERKESS